MVLTWLILAPLASSVTVTNSDPAAVRAAIEGGGAVKLSVDGAVHLTAPLLITSDTTVEAVGRETALDGGNVTRHFVVTNGATLRLINLTLKNGRFVGAQGQTNQPGEPGLGGSIYNSGGRLELVKCQFIENHVLAGNGGFYGLQGPGLGYPIKGTQGGAAYGGAVYSANGETLATDCFFVSNSCTGGQGESAADTYTGGGGDAFGGAIYSTNGVLEIIGATFRINLAQGGEMSWGRPEYGGGAGHGGAVSYESTTAVITGSEFDGNRVLGASRMAGSRGTSTDPFFDANRSGHGQGGAIYQGSGSLRVAGTFFSGNIAQGGPGRNNSSWRLYSGAGLGGAFYNESGRMEVRNSAFESNRTQGGNADEGLRPGGSEAGLAAGGVLFNRGAIDLINCTLAGNAANGGVPNGPAYGGAIFNVEGELSLLNVTVADNSVHVGSVWVASVGSSIAVTNGTVALTNTILSCEQSQTNVWGTIQDGGHNISSDESAQFTRESSMNGTDPMLGPLADNGGPTPTMALLPGSPAIDAGDGSVCPGVDQRGVARPQGAGCDIGAFELAPKLKLRLDAGGTVKVEYQFLPLKEHRVFASTDLVQWLELGACLTDKDGAFEFEDEDWERFSRRFYHVKPQSASE
jgi:hypothetical protein